MTESELEPGPKVAILNSLESEAIPLEHTYFKPAAGGGVYWHNLEQSWINIPKRILEIILKNEHGLADFVNTKAGEVVSDLEVEMARITTRNRVFYAGPLAGYKMGVYEFEGEQALVTKSMELLEPRAGSWDTLAQLFEGAFNDRENELDQRPVFFAWWKHILESLYGGYYSRGCALVMAGERESGKSLISELIKETLGKRHAQPYAWMIEKDNFNEELFESTLLVVDDENADTALAARLKFASKIKQIVAVPGARCRGLHQKANTLKPVWRLLICVNMEPDRLMVLPPIDDDVEDKMIMIKACKNTMPMPVGTEAEKSAFWDQLARELPCFIHFLLNEFVIRDSMQGRFGVRFWHHPDIVKELTVISPEQQILEFIERYFRKESQSSWSGTPSDLRTTLKESAGLTYTEQDELPKPAWMGRRLRKLQKQWPTHYTPKDTKRGTVWTINRIWEAEPLPMKEIRPDAQ